MSDTVARNAVQRARDELVAEFEVSTREWIADPESARGKEHKAKRDVLATQLKENYWKLDKYVRARSLYDRQGIIRSGLETAWYSQPATDKAAGDEATSSDGSVEQVEDMTKGVGAVEITTSMPGIAA
ncbi:hypothetical protein E4U42_002986 [Claviceps africana]|uniref:Uncharacterized protein n=1 Tax=Claviceps africana TaxID=83212 RepID=A0A8K0J9Z2_9HYPO|nr:hypothetical protein E4U42_002986 [Claviceps africana]